MIISFQNYAKINLPYRHILSIIKRVAHIFVFLLLIISANGIYADPPPGNTTECSCCTELISQNKVYCSACYPCPYCSNCKKNSDSCTRTICDCERPCNTKCSDCDRCTACSVCICFCTCCNTTLSGGGECEDCQVKCGSLACHGCRNQSCAHSCSCDPTCSADDICSFENCSRCQACDLHTHNSAQCSCCEDNIQSGDKCEACQSNCEECGKCRKTDCQNECPCNPACVSSDSCDVCHQCTKCDGCTCPWVTAVNLISGSPTVILKGGDPDIYLTAELSGSGSMPTGGQIIWQRKKDAGDYATISGQPGVSITLEATDPAGAGKYTYRAKFATGNDSYKTSGELIVYDIRIKRGDDDITDDTTEVWVGEKISLTYEILPENSGVTLENNHWYIPESRIKNYTFTEDEGEIEELTDYDLQEDTIDFYWVNGAVGGELKEVGFVNLDGVDIVQTANFLVKSPELLFPLGGYKADCAYLYTYSGTYVLGKGIESQYLNLGFDITIRLKNNVGDTKWAQVIDTSCIESWFYILLGTISYHKIENESNGLDNSFVTGDVFSDSPCCGIFDTYYKKKVDTDFYVCYMFKPNVSGEAIYVPQWCCEWGWDSEASGSINLSNWNIDNYVDGYSVVEQNNINQSDIPEWDNKITN